jgi:exodeoxyribonuclease VII small subunit
MKKKSPDNEATAIATPHPESFEAASAELETIVEAMEAGKMSLEDSLSAYKRGVELLQYCQTTLKNSQQQIKILEADMLKNFSTAEQDER